MLGILWGSLSTAGPVQRAQEVVPHAATILHVAAYAALAGAVVYVWLPDEARPLARGLFVFAGVFGYGLGVEGLQALVPGRLPDPVDVLANALGAATALAWDPFVARFTPSRGAAGDDANP